MRLQLLALLSLPLLSFASQEQQIVMSNDVTTDYSPATNTKPTLADLLTIEPSASIFYSYARELELSAMFSEPSTRSTLFAPTNKAVMALARKPHQGASMPSDEGIHISEEEFDKLSKQNVERWVSAHIVPKSPISLESEEQPTMLDGKSISFTPITKNDGQGPEWSRVTLEDGVRIVDMKEGLNGVLYLIDGTIAYE
ncbi:putative protein with four repeated domains in the Fasciclin I family of proteins, present in many other contexts [Lyophyllum shimeji]|uniref:FAS1 domain-containing protein n=1 Tax=Lyophyllum shimeji TaxID=47721 RepID=A0A9P3PVK7_LYOSH|nr:putative protein with four repeated domains in the Fasciclin I family of proteins, present in many other contexts [Lyophyllum shimeji]